MPVFGRSRVPLLPTNRRPTRRCLSGILFEQIVSNPWVSPSNEPCRKSRPRSIRPSRADSQNNRHDRQVGPIVLAMEKQRFLKLARMHSTALKNADTSDKKFKRRTGTINDYSDAGRGRQDKRLSQRSEESRALSRRWRALSVRRPPEEEKTL